MRMIKKTHLPMRGAMNEVVPKQGRKRGPGRPVAEQTFDLRDVLLAAALVCFARKGIAATTLREIAAEAGVTPALLHYYFGDKAQLQQAVIEERILPIIGTLREPLAKAGDDIAMLIAGFVDGIDYPAIDAALHPFLCAAGG